MIVDILRLSFFKSLYLRNFIQSNRLLTDVSYFETISFKDFCSKYENLPRS